jgi:hypothetical protein
MSSKPKRQAAAKLPAKRGPGRPATGRDPTITGRVPENVISAMDEWAERRGVTRSTAMAQLIELGLKHAPKSPPKV